MTSATSWVLFPAPNPHAKLRLFCFSHAGAGASTFRSWGAIAASQDIEVCCVQRPGRENRFREAPYREVTALVRQLHTALLPYLDQPFVCFGHSVGALICFEWVRYLQQQKAPLPLRLFVSGRQAPQIPAKLPWAHTLSRDGLISELRSYGGTREAVLQNAEIMDLYLPILRADLAIHEAYTYCWQKPLSMPISAFGGLADPKISKAGLEAWAQQTEREFSLRLLPGGHLFIDDSIEEVVKAIAQDIALQAA